MRVREGYRDVLLTRGRFLHLKCVCVKVREKEKERKREGREREFQWRNGGGSISGIGAKYFPTRSQNLFFVFDLSPIEFGDKS